MVKLKKEEYQFPSGAKLTIHYKGGVLHGDDQPAIVLDTGAGLSLRMHFRDSKLESACIGTLEVTEDGGAGLAIQFRDGHRVNAGFPMPTAKP